MADFSETTQPMPPDRDPGAPSDGVSNSSGAAPAEPGAALQVSEIFESDIEELLTLTPRDDESAPQEAAAERDEPLDYELNPALIALDLESLLPIQIAAASNAAEMIKRLKEQNITPPTADLETPDLGETLGQLIEADLRNIMAIGVIGLPAQLTALARQYDEEAKLHTAGGDVIAHVRDKLYSLLDRPPEELARLTLETLDTGVADEDEEATAGPSNTGTSSFEGFDSEPALTGTSGRQGDPERNDDTHTPGGPPNDIGVAGGPPPAPQSPPAAQTPPEPAAAPEPPAPSPSPPPPPPAPLAGSAPTTDDAAASGAEDAASIAVTLTGSDVDGTVQSFALSSLPANGTLYTDAGLTTLAATGVDYAATAESLTLYFVPNADYNGAASFDFAAKDDSGASDASPATATITVTAVNDAPTTSAAAATGAEDAASIAVTLTGSDVDGTVQSFALSSLPANGTLYTDAGLTTLAATGVDYAATAESLTLYFVPNADYNGAASFDFAARDDSGASDASPATATITVTAVNDAPTTSAAAASGAEDAASIAVTLTGSDLDGTVQSFALSSLPANGTLYTDAGLTTLAATGVDYAATAESLTLYFVPNADYNGVTSFDFAARDDSGASDASPATATITVTAVNDAPTTSAAAASGAEDAASIAVTLTGSDVDGTVQSFALSSLPANGTLYTDAGLTTLATTGVDYAATAESLTLYFVPNADYNGATSFDFAARDDSGAADASPATATITVTAVNDAPTTSAAAASGAEDAASIAVTLTGSDIDGTVQSFALSSLPANGTLYTDAGLTTLAATGVDYAATAESLTLYFVPNADYNGAASFDFAARDDSGASDASPATATVTVTAVNDAPVAITSLAGLNSGSTVNGTLSATDIDNTAASLTFALETGASNGSVIVNADGSYSYTANAGFSGADSFTFRVTDPGGASSTATVSVSVATVDDLDLTSGSEARVNTTTAHDQSRPDVAGLSGGGYVAVWQSDTQDGSREGIYGQRYDASGNTLGSEFRINTTTARAQIDPAVDGLNGGGFVVVWRQRETDDNEDVIYGQRYDAGGNTLGSQFAVTSNSQSQKEDPDVAGLNDGGYVVVWQNGDIYARQYDSAGNATGSRFRVNSTTSSTQQMAAVSELNDGGYVVVWESNNQDGSSYGIFGQRYNASGSAVGSEFQVNTATANAQQNAAVTNLIGGGFVVVWQSDNQDGNGLGVFGQRFDASGNAVGSEFQVNTTTANDQWQPTITALDDGGFLVAWTSQGQDGGSEGVYGQRFDSSGNTVSSEFLINTTTANAQDSPAATLLSDGDVAVVWESGGQDGNGEGVYSHVYQATSSAPVTYNGGAGNDSFVGGVNADTLNGAGGNDRLEGGAGADRLNGGAGNDILIWDSADTLIDGGTGSDILQVTSGNIDLTAFGGTISGIETIDLQTDSGANTITLTATDILSVSDTDTITILGDAGDTLNAGSGWSDNGFDGDGNHLYSQVVGLDTLTLVVDPDMTVNLV